MVRPPILALGGVRTPPGPAMFERTERTQIQTKRKSDSTNLNRDDNKAVFLWILPLPTDLSRVDDSAVVLPDGGHLLLDVSLVQPPAGVLYHDGAETLRQCVQSRSRCGMVTPSVSAAKAVVAGEGRRSG